MRLVAAAASVLLVASLLRFSSAQGCGGRIVSAPTTISSPNFPRNYPPGAVCKWLVLAPAGRSVEINISRLALGGDLDVLRIFDGVNVTCDTPITGYTKVNAGASRSLLLGQNVTVGFWSDGLSNAAGFQLSIRFVNATGSSSGASSAATTTPSSRGCGGSLTGSGRLTSPGYPSPYAPNARCEWLLIPATGQQVTIRVVKLRLESPWDTLRFYLSASPSLNELPVAEYTRTVDNATMSFRAGSSVKVVFQSDESIQYAGFEALFYSSINSEALVVPPSILPRPDTCGVPTASGVTKAVDGSNRIVGGEPAAVKAWPWQIQLTYQNSFICGGSLISSQWVITAAHCILRTSPKLFKVLLGKYNQLTTDASLRSMAVSKVLVHQGYDKIPEDSDIALVKLAQAVTFNDAIKPICLPLEDAPPGVSCYVTGWGDTEGTGSDTVLRQVAIPILSRRCCSNFLQDRFTKNMTCAGYIDGGKDTCQGDSGGPLVCNVNGTFWLYGVTSWGFGCADPYWPGLYTRVPGFYNWIRSTIANN